LAACEPLVDDRQIAVDASLEKCQDNRVTRGLGEILQKPKRAEEAIHLLIIEDHPAQRLEFFVLALWLEFSTESGEVGQDHAGLRELSCTVHKDRRFSHFIDFSSKFRRALNHCAEKVDPEWLPIGVNQIEH
jgi:hypothetical protein